MTDEDKLAIERYARAHYTNPRIEEMRQTAVEVHRRNLRVPSEGSNPREGWNFHMKFMSEVDTPCPDYVLRAKYRKQLLGGRAMSTMTWERADEATIDSDVYYVVQHNGHEWRDFDLAILSGALVMRRLRPDYIRGRPEWIAKIVRPITKATREQP